MAANNSYFTRASRSATPLQQHGENSAITSGNNMQELWATTQSTWTEPPLRPPQPSFLDHKGLERTGVLDQMQPLGTRPTAKMKARARQEPRSLRRAVQGRTLDGGLGEDVRMTPDRFESTPLPESTPAMSPSLPSDDRSRLATPTVNSLPENQNESLDEQYDDEEEEDDDDEDGLPAGPLPATTPMQLSVTTPTAPASSANIASTPPVTHRQSITQTTPAKSPSPFDKAIAEFNRRGQPRQSQMVIYLHSVAQRDSEFTALLVANTHKFKTTDQEKSFRKKVRKLKRELRDMGGLVNEALPDVSGDSTLSKQSSSNRVRADSTNFNDSTQHSNIDPRLSTSAFTSSQRLSLTNQTSPSTSKVLSHSEAAQSASFPPSSNSPYKFPRFQSRSSAMASSNSEPLTEQQANQDGGQCDESSTPLSDVDDKVVARPPPGVMRSKPSRKAIPKKRKSAWAKGDDLPSEERMKTEEDRAKRARYDETAVKESDLQVQESSLRPQTDPPLAQDGSVARLQSPQSRQSLRTLENASNQLTPAELRELQSKPIPTALGRPPKEKKPGNGPRVKLSPIKPKNSNVVTTAAGMSRNERRKPEAPVPDVQTQQAADNQDFCSACGGQGYLLCCDGCNRSFHFTCLDPPLENTASLSEPWYCYVCLSTGSDRKSTNRSGIFAPLLERIGKTNPSIFILPPHLRDYFEGMQTGSDGEYVPTANRKATNRGGAGYDENPDYLRLRDRKGKPIICYACRKSSEGRREIIPCDYCEAAWHLDCLNPPRANPPFRGLGQHRAPWMCPLHNEHDLRHLDPIAGNMVSYDAIPSAHRIRRPRVPVIKRTHLNRGHSNNGLIEVEDSESEEESDFVSENEDGTIPRLPAKAIKLDFIYQVKRRRIEEEASNRFAASQKLHEAAIAELEAAKIRQHNEEVVANMLARRTDAERRVALQLVQFATQSNDLHLSSKKIYDLIYNLEAEAPASNTTGAEDSNSMANNVIAPTPMSGEERTDLLRLRELINRRLNESQS